MEKYYQGQPALSVCMQKSHSVWASCHGMLAPLSSDGLPWGRRKKPQVSPSCVPDRLKHWKVPKGDVFLNKRQLFPARYKLHQGWWAKKSHQKAHGSLGKPIMTWPRVSLSHNKKKIQLPFFPWTRNLNVSHTLLVTAFTLSNPQFINRLSIYKLCTTLKGHSF